LNKKSEIKNIKEEMFGVKYILIIGKRDMQLNLYRQ